MIDFILGLGMAVEMFTNGSGISADFARWLYARRVRVVLKMNTFDPALQDRLAGRQGAAGLIASALERLKAAGYPSDEAFLAISTIICRPNLPELPHLWCWLRDQASRPISKSLPPRQCQPEPVAFRGSDTPPGGL